MKLYANEVSSATSRVRIALALKGLHVEIQPVNIFGVDAESRSPEYRKVNPQGLVPALLTDEGTLITQSLAIIEYLNDLHPEPPLLPVRFEARALSRSVALAIASEIHALLPPRVALRLSAIPGVDANEIADWNRHWIREGLTAIEATLASRRMGAFVAGDQPSVADIFLFPQAINTERARIDLSQWPAIAEIVSNLRAIPAFADHAPAVSK